MLISDLKMRSQLPLHTRLKDEEVKYVIEQYCKIVGEHL